MIFVITGTEAFPFNRLIIELDRIKQENEIKDEIYIQLGSCTYKPKYCTWDKWLQFDILCEQVRKADKVIAHAGAGTTLLCLELGKTPIIVTRRKKYNEHLDDHQVSFAKMMEKLDYAIVAYDVNEINDCLKKSSSKKKDTIKFTKNNLNLINYLNSWLNS